MLENGIGQYDLQKAKTNKFRASINLCLKDFLLIDKAWDLNSQDPAPVQPQAHQNREGSGSGYFASRKETTEISL
jgi:hypothetical protein